MQEIEGTYTTVNLGFTGDDFQDLEQCYKQYESELLNSMQEELCQQETVASVSAATKYVPGFGMASSYLKSPIAYLINSSSYSFAQGFYAGLAL